MPRNPEAKREQKLIDDINGEKKSFLKEATKTLGRWALIGAVGAGSILGISKADENEKMPNTPVTVENGTKGAAPEIDLNKLQPGVNPQEDLAVDPETKEAEIYENSTDFGSNDGAGAVEAERAVANETSSMTVDPATKGTEIYKNSQDFANNDGQKAVGAEQEAPKSSIGEAWTAPENVEGDNDPIIDAATGETVDSKEG